MTDVKIILSSKNEKQFVIKNYIFEPNKIVNKGDQKTYYANCTHYRVNKCKAKCIIKEDLNGSFFVKSLKSDHLEHIPPVMQLMAGNLKKKLKTQIEKVGDTKPFNQIYKDSVQEMKNELKRDDFLDFQIPYSQVYSYMYRVKNKTTPRLPKS